MLRLNREHSAQRNESESRLPSDDPSATATAEPLDEPPGMRFVLRLKGFFGVPKYRLNPEGESANSLRFVLPTTRTFRARASAMQVASRSAGGSFLETYSDPAVVTTPFKSMRSFTARRKRPLLFGGGQYTINALSGVPVRECLCRAEQPLRQLIEQSPRVTRATRQLRFIIGFDAFL